MGVFILSFRRQNIAIKEAAYQSALTDCDSIRLMLERTELGPVMDEVGEGPGETKREDRVNQRK